MYILDNECSNDLRKAFAKKNIYFQLKWPHIYWSSAAERAIQTFKAHLKAGLASLDLDFPVSKWDRLLLQAELALKLLCASRSNPKLSAYAYMFGQFDYNCIPLVPPGKQVYGYLKSTVRSTCSDNGEEGWNVGPSMDHYRCIDCYFPTTKSQRNIDTVKKFKAKKSPKVSIDDFYARLPQMLSQFWQFHLQLQLFLSRLVILYKINF